MANCARVTPLAYSAVTSFGLASSRFSSIFPPADQRLDLIANVGIGWTVAGVDKAVICVLTGIQSPNSI